MLLHAAAKALEGAKVVVAGPNDVVRRTIEIVGLEPYLTVANTSAEQVLRDMPMVDDVL